MIVSAIDVSSITGAIYAMLTDAPSVGGMGVIVEVAEQINEGPTDNGWVGIYHERLRFPARALGVAAGFRKQLTSLIVLIQASDPDSGQACGERLGELVKNVVSVVLNDTTLRGTVENIGEDLEVSYERYEKGDDGYNQTAALYLVAEAYVNATAS